MKTKQTKASDSKWMAQAAAFRPSASTTKQTKVSDSKWILVVGYILLTPGLVVFVLGGFAIVGMLAEGNIGASLLAMGATPLIGAALAAVGTVIIALGRILEEVGKLRRET